MTVAEFWNQAFLAALTRVSAREAALEADRALDACVSKWQPINGGLFSSEAIHWQHASVLNLPPMRNGKRIPTRLDSLKRKLRPKKAFERLCRFRQRRVCG